MMGRVLKRFFSRSPPELSADLASGLQASRRSPYQATWILVSPRRISRFGLNRPVTQDVSTP